MLLGGLIGHLAAISTATRSDMGNWWTMGRWWNYVNQKNKEEEKKVPSMLYCDHPNWKLHFLCLTIKIYMLPSPKD